jgi:murein DD-endopeptidase MepM/ murein hydrolase activator NlpD
LLKENISLEVLILEENNNIWSKWKKRILNFLERKNFYVMIVLCIGTIIFSGLFITSRNIISSIEYNNEGLLSEENNVGRVSDEIDVSSNILEPKPVKPIENKSKPAIPVKKHEKKPEKKIVNKTIPPTKTNNLLTNKLNFELPVKGKMILDFADVNPVYSKTLNEWRCHLGVDLAEQPGTAVKAVMDGIVTEVKNDPRFGYTVIVSHGNDLKTLYAAMVKSETVVPNQKIKTGEVLGIIGNTAPFEALETAHLHFEVIKNGVNVDPKKYIPQLKQ